MVHELSAGRPAARSAPATAGRSSRWKLPDLGRTTASRRARRPANGWRRTTDRAAPLSTCG
ncbi:hypothetical protein HBB16_14180 [Pseudonocardia sp. MCCB 268]|nr:hypothetical protein [Pseudonocardia cytotoxica]